jgi:hypothetical protein
MSLVNPMTLIPRQSSQGVLRHLLTAKNEARATRGGYHFTSTPEVSGIVYTSREDAAKAFDRMDKSIADALDDKDAFRELVEQINREPVFHPHGFVGEAFARFKSALMSKMPGFLFKNDREREIFLVGLFNRDLGPEWRP